MMILPSLASSKLLRLIAIATTLLVASCGDVPTLEIVNETPFPLFHVELVGDGFHESFDKIGKGESTSVRVRPEATTTLLVRFTVAGQPVEHAAVATVAPGAGSSMKLHVELDFSIRVEPTKD